MEVGEDHDHAHHMVIYVCMCVSSLGRVPQQ